MARPRAALTAAALVAVSLIGCGDGETGGGTSADPAEMTRSKSAAPGVPTSKGGDNSIQTYGLEAPASERALVTPVVRGFLDARAQRDWPAACSYLAAEQARMFERLATTSLQLEDPSCAAALEASTPSTEDGAPATESDLDVLSLRLGGAYAFLIYRRRDGAVHATALRRERGIWVEPTELR